MKGKEFGLTSHSRPCPWTRPPPLVTATGLPKSPAKLTVPVAVVPREAIDLSGAENVAGLLGDVAGINVHSTLYGYLGSPTGIMIQGIGPQRILILVDGERVIGGAGGVIDLAQLPTSQVERVEVVQGPHSALYGSDAMGGVVHIITRSPRQKRGGDLRFGLGSGGLTSFAGRSAFARSALSASLMASMTTLEALDRSPQDPRYRPGRLNQSLRPGPPALAGAARAMAASHRPLALR